MARLADKCAVVTGASRGIGAAVARHMAVEGAKVLVNYNTAKQEAEQVVREIEAEGGHAFAWQADVGVPAQVKAMVAAARERFGPVDILVSNAGTVRDSLLAGMSYEAWTEVLHVNLTGAFTAIREVIADMVARRSGSIVCLSSVHAQSRGNGQCNYAAAKAGVEALTRSLALEVASRGVRVNAVAPGLIATRMTRTLREAAGPELLKEIPMRRFGDPLEVARAVTFLASPEASYITGTTLHVAGGLGL